MYIYIDDNILYFLASYLPDMPLYPRIYCI